MNNNSTNVLCSAENIHFDFMRRENLMQMFKTIVLSNTLNPIKYGLALEKIVQAYQIM